MIDKEIWKNIEGYEGLYQVSNLGRVKSLARLSSQSNGKAIYPIVVKEKILTQTIRSKGMGVKYKAVTLCEKGKELLCSTHRLVAKAFIPNPENKPQVNHIDHNPANNNVTNLEWVTAEENTLHFINHGRHPLGNHFSKDDIYWIQRLYIAGYTQQKISDHFNVTISRVNKVLGGKIKMYNKFLNSQFLKC